MFYYFYERNIKNIKCDDIVFVKFKKENIFSVLIATSTRTLPSRAESHAISSTPQS
jgi:hypothetical protein